MQGSLFLEDLPAHSFYRYLLSFFLCLFLLIPSSQIPAIFHLPETHFFYSFLGTWEENPLNRFSYFFAPYFKYPGIKSFFVFFHFLCLCLAPLVQACIFLLSIFFWKDLSYFLLSLPLSLVPLIYRLVYDYFSTFVRENLGSLRAYLVVHQQGNHLSRGSSWLDVRNSSLSFELTPLSLKEGLSLDRLQILWYHLATCDGFLCWLEERSFFFYFYRWVLFLPLLSLLHLCSFLSPWSGYSLSFWHSLAKHRNTISHPVSSSLPKAHPGW